MSCNFLFFFKQKTAYEMRISDWSSDVCSSDLEHEAVADDADVLAAAEDLAQAAEELRAVARQLLHLAGQRDVEALAEIGDLHLLFLVLGLGDLKRFRHLRELLAQRGELAIQRSDEHTSELQSLMRISYADFCLKKKKTN